MLDSLQQNNSCLISPLLKQGALRQHLVTGRRNQYEEKTRKSCDKCEFNCGIACGGYGKSHGQ